MAFDDVDHAVDQRHARHEVQYARGEGRLRRAVEAQGRRGAQRGHEGRDDEDQEVVDAVRLHPLPGGEAHERGGEGATLIGASRFIAAEFSFFLAIPTMFGASALKLIKTGFQFNTFQWLILLIGSFVSFIVSIFAIKFLMDYIKKHNFKSFGYYRIVLGLLVLLYFYVIVI